MNPQLTSELFDALRASGDELEIIDPSTNRVYVIVDQEKLRVARAALAHQEVIAAITRGNEQAEAGKGMTLQESFQRGCEELIASSKRQ